MTIDIQERISDLKQILQQSLSVDDTITFDSLPIKEKFPSISPKPELVNPLPPPTKEEFLKDLKPPSGLQKLIPGSQDKYRTALREVQAKYRLAFRTYWNKWV